MSTEHDEKACAAPAEVSGQDEGAERKDTGSTKAMRAVLCLEGRLGMVSGRHGWRVFRVLTGLIYLVQLVRFLAWMFGYRTRVALRLEETALRVTMESSLLGVRTSERHEVLPLGALRSVAAVRPGAALFLWLGGSLFAACVAAAVVFAFRGRVGFGTSLGLVALAFLSFGLALDLGAYAATQGFGLRNRGSVEVQDFLGRRLLVCGVPWSDAGRFVDAVLARLPRPEHPMSAQKDTSRGAKKGQANV